jgi:hypothetical protein
MATATDNVLNSLSRPCLVAGGQLRSASGSMAELFFRAWTCQVAVRASDVGFLALVAPETLGFHPANLPYQAPASAHNFALHAAYEAGDLVHGSDLAVSLGGGR